MILTAGNNCYHLERQSPHITFY